MSYTVLDHGVFKKVDELSPNHLSFNSSRDIFSMPANLITGLGGVSGGRILLGSKSSLQSIPLVKPERALVESSDNTDKESTQEKFGKKRAEKQAVAVALHEQDQSSGHEYLKPANGGKK